MAAWRAVHGDQAAADHGSPATAVLELQSGASATDPSRLRRHRVALEGDERRARSDV